MFEWIKGMFNKEGILWDVIGGAGGHVAAEFLKGEEGKRFFRQARVRMNPEAYVFAALLALEDDKLDEILRMLEEVKEKEGTDDRIVRALAINLPLTESGEVDTEKAAKFLLGLAERSPKQREALLSVLQRDSWWRLRSKEVKNAVEAMALFGTMLASCGYTLAADKLRERYQHAAQNAARRNQRIPERIIAADRLWEERRARRAEMKWSARRRTPAENFFAAILSVFDRIARRRAT